VIHATTKQRLLKITDIFFISKDFEIEEYLNIEGQTTRIERSEFIWK